MRRLSPLAAASAAALVVLGVQPAHADPPRIERDSHVDRFEDDLILELCGIRTWTTLTETWSSKKFADGSETLHVVRTFVPDDRRIPIEKGAGTSFVAADGTWTTVGTPIHLIARGGGGTTLIDAGRALFDATGHLASANGPHPSLGADLARFYCPR